MMCKALFKDHYTSGRILYTCSRIPYMPVYVSVYILYTEGIMRYTDVVWKVHVRDSNICVRISYSPVHMTVCVMYTA